MNAGQGTICRNCRQFNQAASNRGHPNPCRLFGWSGNVHYEPVLSEDGRQCVDFWQRGRRTRPKNHGLETKQPENRHGENAPSPDIGDSAAESGDPVDVATTVDGHVLVSEAIEAVEDSEAAGYRVMAGKPEQLPGTTGQGDEPQRGNVGQETIDS